MTNRQTTIKPTRIQVQNQTRIVAAALVESRGHIIQAWINDGRIAAISPLHLLFFIWAATQHYADFRAQIDILYDGDEQQLFNDAERTLKQMITQGLKP